uniref:Ras-related protein Rab-18 n=1 Tax=Macrostomum lignano TaxID=282301 RepID=A0A1I8J2V5_9PLAT
MYSASGEQKLETPKETADMKRRWTFKSVVLGDSGVGKTWLVDTALAGLSGQDDREKDAGTDEAGDHSQEAGTVGVTFNLAKMELEGGSTVMLQVWDTSGKERYRGLLANYMIDLSCAIIAFDPCRDSAEACCAALAGWHQLWLDGQQLSAAWLGCELLRRKFCPPSRPLVRLGTAGTAEEAPLRRRQARSCCQLLATQLHSLLRLPAMAFLLLLSRRAPDQE